MPKSVKKDGCPSDSEIGAELRRLMRYEPETGFFIRITNHRKCIAGQVAGSTHADGRVFIGLLGFRFAAHRLAVLWMTGRMPANEVDHINCDHSDNRWENLRECTSSQNKWNRRANFSNGTGVKGVRYKKRRNKYEASFKVNRREIYLGSFSTLDEASRAISKARKEAHGEFARS